MALFGFRDQTSAPEPAPRPETVVFRGTAPTPEPVRRPEAGIIRGAAPTPEPVRRPEAVIIRGAAPTPDPAIRPVQGANLIGRATVIDGDTIDIRGQRIRLWGVDAPESAQLCTSEGKAWQCGRNAAGALADWIGVRTVECDERTRDQYRRIVALCRVSGVDMSAWLAENGWALAFRRYSGDYVAHENRARAARRGVWTSQFQAPWEWRAERRNGGKR